MEQQPEPQFPPCRDCGVPQATYPPSRIRNHSWICSRCANQSRDSSCERYLARKFAEYLRRNGYQKPYPGVAFVRALLEKTGHKDDADWRNLAIVIQNPQEDDPVPLEVLLERATIV